MELIDKAALVAEIDKRIKQLTDASFDSMIGKNLIEIKDFLDTIEEKDVDLENYNKVKRTLSLSFMNFLDNNRPEGKMCLSNGECFDIDKAFNEMDFAKLFRYMKKYLKI